MADDDDFSSDTSDDDYIPTCDDVGSDDEKVEKDGDSSSEHGENGSSGKEQKETAKSSGRKRRKPSEGGLHSRKTKRGLQNRSECEGKDPETEVSPQKQNGNSVKIEDGSENDNKAKVDLLWADFLKDVDTKPAEKKASCSNTPVTTEPAKVKITKVFEFAGEEVRVTEEVSAHSKEAKQGLETAPFDSASQSTTNTSMSSLSKKPAGLGSILSKLGGPKKKLSTLEKSRLDWNEFKDKEGISDELKTHNRGKAGYLEKQAFLERADLRQYEIEKNLRVRGRSNR